MRRYKKAKVYSQMALVLGVGLLITGLVAGVSISGNARALFFSADPAANVVGATADLLLEGDEAQDINAGKWSKDFKPMGASTNVTTILWGTAWTSSTLLAQTIALLAKQHARDSIQRVFLADADVVGHEVPNYAAYVKSEVDRLGRQHPLIKTQYYLEEIDSEGKYLDPDRIALMHGTHARQRQPTPSHRYAFLVDVAGEDEEAGDAITRAMLSNPKRDATTLTVVEIELASNRLPVYRTVNRYLWLGTPHTALHQTIMALFSLWHPVFVIVDASGVGAGLCSFLRRSIDHDPSLNVTPGQQVIPVQFTSSIKTYIGWNFLGIVGTGRYQDYVPDGEPDTRQFWYEVGECDKIVGTGPNAPLKWGVWASPRYDGLIAYGHDDLLIGAALTAILEQHIPALFGTGASAAIAQPDPMEEIDDAAW